MEFVPGQGFSSREAQHLELELFATKDMDAPSSSGGGGGGEAAEREHMFEKVVTPSDVGKLNRLVIPKQHAERYFPLDPTNSDKGLFLNFQDSSGKSWRFRYSYWTSSQSYVMTKGWSRFVKDKKLDAGDTVSFLRSKLDSSSLFIDWRRSPALPHHHHHHHHFSPSFHRPSSPWTPLFPQPNHYWISHAPNYDSHVFRNHYPGTISTTPNSFSGSGSSSSSSRRWIDIDPTVVLESVPVVQGKKLRLFGVNMEMDYSSSQPDDSDPTSYGRSLQQQPNNDNEEGKPSSNSHSDMSLDFHM